MEEAETKRLMYVALTRAADRLILSGQSNSSSWMAQITSALGIPEHGDEAAVLLMEEFSLEVKRPAYQEAMDARDGKTAARENLALTAIPELAQPFTLPEQERPGSPWKRTSSCI